MSKKLHIKLFDRNFDALVNPPTLDFTINRYSRTIYGGCKEAHITAFGNSNNLWELANMLRFGLYIYDKLETPVWYGYIAEVKIKTGNLVFGVSIDSMSNAISVIYTSFGVRNQTSMVYDEYSRNEYGIKELLTIISDATESEALQRRSSDLKSKKLPIPSIDFESQPEGSFSATITCRGFYDTYGWRYYSQEKGLVQHSNNGVGQQSIGIHLANACLVFSGSPSASDSLNKISHWDEALEPFKKGQKISITGTSNNNGVFTVNQGSSSGSSIRVVENIVDEISATTNVTTASQVMQQFFQSSGSDWDSSSIHIRVQASGSPTDDLMVALYSTSNGSAISLLSSGCITASNMQPNMQWVEVPQSACVTLVNNVSYGVSLYRSSTPTSACHYYKVDMDEGLSYQDGDFYIKTSNGWQRKDDADDADMLFKVVGTQPVSNQIKEISDTVGQFFTGTISEIASGCSVETNQYRNGETTGLVEINNLLKVGTKDNLVILADITDKRKLIISEQPDKDNNDNIYKIDLDGKLKSPKGIEIENSQCKVGVWARIDGFMPSTFDKNFLATPGQFFIEEAEYYAQADKYVPRSKDTSNVWDLGKIKDG